MLNITTTQECKNTRTHWVTGLHDRHVAASSAQDDMKPYLLRRMSCTGHRIIPGLTDLSRGPSMPNSVAVLYVTCYLHGPRPEKPRRVTASSILQAFHSSRDRIASSGVASFMLAFAFHRQQGVTSRENHVKQAAADPLCMALSYEESTLRDVKVVTWVDYGHEEHSHVSKAILVVQS